MMKLDENNTVVMLCYRVVAASDGLVNVNFVIEFLVRPRVPML